MIMFLQKQQRFAISQAQKYGQDVEDIECFKTVGGSQTSWVRKGKTAEDIKR